VSPIAVLEVHGDADPIVRYDGGRIFNDRALDAHPSAPETLHDWAERLGCAGAPKQATADLDPRLPGAETRIESYADCRGGTAELWTVHGGAHQVMTPALLARVGEFLAAHPKAPPKNKTAPKRQKREGGIKLPN
jgi:poly(3-hydroxybutyrate) depolymerase